MAAILIIVMLSHPMEAHLRLALTAKTMIESVDADAGQH